MLGGGGWGVYLYIMLPIGLNKFIWFYKLLIYQQITVIDEGPTK